MLGQKGSGEAQKMLLTQICFCFHSKPFLKSECFSPLCKHFFHYFSKSFADVVLVEPC